MKWRPWFSRLLSGNRHIKPMTDEQVRYTLHRPNGRIDVIRRDGEFDIYRGKRS